MIVGVRAFGHFELEHPRLQFVLFEQTRQKFGQVQAVEIQPRQVHRNRDNRLARVKTFSLQATSFLPDETVKPHDKAVALKDGYELAGRHHAVNGVKPPHESFRADDGICHGVEYRLQVNRELIFEQGGFHVARDELLFNHLFAHFGIVIGVARQVTALDSPQSHAGTVAHLVNRQFRVVNRIDAREK